MLLTKFKGRQVHFYQLDGCEFYVVRSSRYAAAMCWDKRSTVVAVLVPPGMSYKQGAMRAAAALKKGEFSHIDAPFTTHVRLFDTGPDAEERGV